MVSTKLHLVDINGCPLARHIVEAVEKAEPKISSRFERFCDPAALSTSLEDGARRIAQHEQDHGPIRNTVAFTWQTLVNAAISLVRDRSREETFPSETLAPLAGASRIGSPESTWAGMQAKETLAGMSERDRAMCILEHQGFEASEIGTFLNMKPNTVMKAKSRRLAKLAADSTTR